jgi:hypothetical protein
MAFALLSRKPYLPDGKAPGRATQAQEKLIPLKIPKGDVVQPGISL